MADLDLYNQVAQNGRDPILVHVGLVKRTALHFKGTHSTSDGCR